MFHCLVLCWEGKKIKKKKTPPWRPFLAVLEDKQTIFFFFGLRPEQLFCCKCILDGQKYGISRSYKLILNTHLQVTDPHLMMDSEESPPGLSKEDGSKFHFIKLHFCNYSKSNTYFDDNDHCQDIKIAPDTHSVQHLQSPTQFLH